MKIEMNDKIEEIVTQAASALADEAYSQNGLENPTQNSVDDGSDDSYYELKEKLRESILKAAVETIKTED
jgi:hypothetical protein